MKPMVARFQRQRWSATRQRIASLQRGDSVCFPLTELNNAKTTIARLRDAYEGARRYRCHTSPEHVTVTRA